MLRLQVLHTSALDAATLHAVHVLLAGAFRDWTEHDWDHTLGGMHALRWRGSDLVAHGAIVQRRLLLDGTALRTGYVEGVAVRADARRRGHGSQVMQALESIAEQCYPVAALSASDGAAAFYASRGWRRWLGRTGVIAPRGLAWTPDDDGGVYVRTALPVDLEAPLLCDWRDGDVW